MSETTRVMKRLINYWREKRLNDKCNIKAQDICEHDWDFGCDTSRKGSPFVRKCNKCLKGEILEPIK